MWRTCDPSHPQRVRSARSAALRWDRGRTIVKSSSVPISVAFPGGMIIGTLRGGQRKKPARCVDRPSQLARRENTAATAAMSKRGTQRQTTYWRYRKKMTQDQFDRESNFRLSFSIFQRLFSLGLLTKEQLAAAREKLVERFQPPIARLPDILAASPV